MVGCSSAYIHILRLSASVRVLRGFDEVRPVGGGAETGVIIGADGSGADEYNGELYVD
jgi:hypothetical protein